MHDGYTDDDTSYHWWTVVSRVNQHRDKCETELFILPFHAGNAGECIHHGRLLRVDRALILLP